MNEIIPLIDDSALQVCSVKKEDLPPEPPNQHAFLMRRSKTPEDRKKEKVRC